MSTWMTFLGSTTFLQSYQNSLKISPAVRHGSTAELPGKTEEAPEGRQNGLQVLPTARHPHHRGDLGRLHPLVAGRFHGKMHRRTGIIIPFSMVEHNN